MDDESMSEKLDSPKKRKEDSSSSSSVPSEQRLHKRRQRKRNQQRKQGSLKELMERITSDDEGLGLSVASIRDLFVPVPSIQNQDLFWQSVPPICNPCTAVLDNTISANPKLLAREKKQQVKYQKKLKMQIQLGQISETERNEMWTKHGRAAKEGVSLLSSDRGKRKALQIENFASLLKHQLEKRTSKERLMVVDFGCGSGNVCLALAAHFSTVLFVLVDKKPYPLKLAERRAMEAGLRNIQVMQYAFSPDNLDAFLLGQGISDVVQEVQGKKERERMRSFDIGIGLHCCGSFTDMVMEICYDRGATCIVCPCCNGAMTAETTCGYKYPRSTLFQEHMSQDEYLEQLSKSADDLENYDAKCLIEYDRAMWAKEKGFKKVDIWKLNPPESTPKHHVLCLQH